MKRILMIDDEPMFVQAYLYSLRCQLGSEFQVDLRADIRTGLQYVRQHGSELACIILDVMLFWGRGWKKDPEKVQMIKREGNLWAGLYILKKVRQFIPHTPVVILTNQRTVAVERRLCRRHWQVAAICNKGEKLPFEFSEVVMSIITNAE